MIPPVDDSSRAQRLDRSLSGYRSYRIGKRLSSPLRKRVSASYKAHPRRTVALIMVIVILTGTVVYAATSLTQTFPQSPQVTSPLVTLNCALLSYPSVMPSNGANTEVLVNCGTTPAFSVATSAADTATFGPFPLPTGITITGLGIVPSTGICGTGETVLTSGTPVTLTAASYDYCVHYNAPPPSNPGVLASFTVTWAN